LSQLTEQESPEPSTKDKEKMQDKLLGIAELVASIPKALLSTAPGVGVASILLGTGLKELGLTTGIDLWPFDRGSPIAKLVEGISGQGAFSSNTLFNLWANTPAGRAYLIEFFPDKVPGELSEEEKEQARMTGQTNIEEGKGNFGFIPVADALIWGGFIALTAEGLKGLGEVIPL